MTDLPDRFTPPVASSPLTLSARQVAAALGCCQKTVRNLVKRGTLPAPIHLGGRRLWYVRELDAALARLHAASNQQPPQPDGQAVRQ